MKSQTIVAGSSIPVLLYLVQATDHRAPATSLRPAVWVSRAAGPFARTVAPVTEVQDGYYELSGGTPDTAMPGPLLIDVPAVGGSDPFAARVDVIASPNVSPIALGSTAWILTWFMQSDQDHLTGVPGLNPTVTLSKGGGAYYTPAGTVYEVGNGPGTFPPTPGLGRGWYAYLPTPFDVSTVGPLLLHAEASGADATDEEFEVTASAIYLPIVTGGPTPTPTTTMTLVVGGLTGSHIITGGLV